MATMGAAKSSTGMEQRADKTHPIPSYQGLRDLGTQPQFGLVPLVLFNWTHASKPPRQISALISPRPGSSSVQLLTSLITINHSSPPNLPAGCLAPRMAEGDFKEPSVFCGAPRDFCALWELPDVRMDLREASSHPGIKCFKERDEKSLKS